MVAAGPGLPAGGLESSGARRGQWMSRRKSRARRDPTDPGAPIGWGFRGHWKDIRLYPTWDRNQYRSLVREEPFPSTSLFPVLLRIKSRKARGTDSSGSETALQVSRVSGAGARGPRSCGGEHRGQPGDTGKGLGRGWPADPVQAWEDPAVQMAAGFSEGRTGRWSWHFWRPGGARPLTEAPTRTRDGQRAAL